MKIVSWNVNGLRAVLRKGFLDYVEQETPDILGIQEIKLQREQIPEEIQHLNGYHQLWSFAEKKGYSGVALFSKEKPLSVQEGLGISKFDAEGRTVIAEFKDFILLNGYFPNGQHDLGRVGFKLEYYAEVLQLANGWVKDGKKVILMGDFNTAHKEIDLKNPKANEKNTGFLPEERIWITRYLENGWIDTFRHFYPDLEEQYTWWSYRMNARARNIGWRIDYVMISPNLLPALKSAFIQPRVMGSDHCPLGIELK